MPTLNWIGKKAVENHHREVPFHLLRDVPDLSVGDPQSGNLIVEGDNLLALKALLPYYAGQVKCICIDPPYNTGNEDWVYNDNVNSPDIKKWLGKVVGSEAEDLSRHDKWLCMMYPRLALLWRFLREDGVIFICLDDNEIQALRYAMDEIFGAQNFIGQIIWQHSIQGKNDAKTISLHHNYIVMYRKSNLFKVGAVARQEKHNANYANPDNDPRGLWRSGDVRSPNFRENLRFDVKTPSGKIIHAPDKGWRWAKETFNSKIETGEIAFVDNESRVLRKIYLDQQGGRVPESIWFGEDCGTTREANAEIKDIFGGKTPFPTPKPTRLIERMLQISTHSGDLVLDSFAGSGTTGHAVLKLNKQDGGNRHFILVEMDQKIVREITTERVGRVVQGYKNEKGEKVEGFGGGFRYCKLGTPCFNERGKINEEVAFSDLARHVFFAETGQPLPKQAKTKSPLIGTLEETAIYLLYNGILKDKKPNGGNVLTQSVLDDLPKHGGSKVVYGTACRLSPTRLKRENIVFKQIPYEIKGR